VFPLARDVFDFEICILPLAIVIGNPDEPRVVSIQIAANGSKDLRVIEKFLGGRHLAPLALTYEVDFIEVLGGVMNCNRSRAGWILISALYDVFVSNQTNIECFETPTVEILGDAAESICELHALS
jgi:hypothetical protein